MKIDLEMKNDKVKYVLFDGSKLGGQHFLKNGMKKYFSGKKYVHLDDWINFRYSNYANNKHHFSTVYHFTTILPIYDSLLKFGFNKNDFILKKDSEYGNNLDYPFPKADKIFSVTVYGENGENYHFNGGYDVLNDRRNKLPWSKNTSNYHRSFIGWHHPTVIENKSENNGKTLFCVCDSQMIPDAPVLSYYYKKTVFLYENEEFDDILFEFYTNVDIDFYKNYFNK